MLSADDLGVFLEVARRGRLTEAAKQLGVNHTTVGRHIVRLERAVESRLFDRRTDGWALTDAGLRLLAHAEAVEAAVTAAHEDCLSKGSKLTGSVRVMAPDGFGVFVLVPGLGAVRAEYGSLSVEVVTANRHQSLTTREFDLAVTIERPDTRSATVRKIADYTLRLYGSPAALAAMGPVRSVEDLRDRTLIWYVEDALGSDTQHLLYDLLPDAQVQIQTNNIAGQIRAAEEGLGVAYLPSYIADPNPRLERVAGLDSGLRRSYWLSTPRSLERLAKVRAMTQAIEQLIRDCPGLEPPR